jgi:hypothetical protein
MASGRVRIFDVQTGFTQLCQSDKAAFLNLQVDGMVHADRSDRKDWSVGIFSFASSPKYVQRGTLPFVQKKQIRMEIFGIGAFHKQEGPATCRSLPDGFFSEFVSFLAVVNETQNASDCG